MCLTQCPYKISQIAMFLNDIFICRPLVPPWPTGAIFRFNYERLNEPAVTQRMGFRGGLSEFK
jgi:hypothetical protein